MLIKQQYIRFLFDKSIILELNNDKKSILTCRKSIKGNR